MENVKKIIKAMIAGESYKCYGTIGDLRFMAGYDEGLTNTLIDLTMEIIGGNVSGYAEINGCLYFDYISDSYVVNIDTLVEAMIINGEVSPTVRMEAITLIHEILYQNEV